MKDKKLTVAAVGAVLAMAVVCAQVVAAKPKAKDMTSKTAESSVTTNDNGSVSRLFTESTVTTNGNMVTERRRETRTNMDMDGNVLETSTSEYAQSYPVGDSGVVPLSAQVNGDDQNMREKGNADSFMGLKFGDKFTSTNFVEDADAPDFLRAEFKPKKPLDGFDDYYVYVTPKTHKIARVYACAKDAVDAGANWRRHYLVEALEKRYGTWARLCSWWKPWYQFEVGPYRHVRACLTEASQSYGTILVAWDDAVGSQAVQEREELREAARKTAAEKRGQRVSAAAEAF